VYFFLIDVSEPALVSGMLHSMTRAIKASLDELPGGNRAQVGELLRTLLLALSCIAGCQGGLCLFAPELVNYPWGNIEQHSCIC
jgi:hypothetical protein